MKYLVLLIVVVVAIGVWRNRRVKEAAPRPTPPRPLALPQDMLACAHCGVHVPQAEALTTGAQAYCCAEHQRLGPA
jgi:uncharacterized protein